MSANTTPDITNDAAGAHSLHRLVRCECDWNGNGKRTLPEVVATHYEQGRLVYERARCRVCGGVAWELGKAPNKQLRELGKVESLKSDEH